jgi:hypothetical protein
MAEAANETSRLPLSAMLSQVLVTFTIECDNEFERQIPHRTSNYGSTAGRGGTGATDRRPGAAGRRAGAAARRLACAAAQAGHAAALPDGAAPRRVP